MKIAVASGKGGTGKTTVSVSLALVASRGTTYADCDVEEPNGHLFLRPTFDIEEIITSKKPVVDYAKCTFCGECSRVCRFHALAVLPKSVMIFEELCHGCGGCLLACPEGAITEKDHPVGKIEKGFAGDVPFIHGILNIGEAMATPLIHAVKDRLPDDGTVVIDAPPGTSCPVIATVSGTDVCLLVTEPTPFGLNDLGLAVEMVRMLGVPFGVVINRDGIGDSQVDEYCAAQKVPVFARIPFDRTVAEGYSRGLPLVEADPNHRQLFLDLHRRLAELAERR